VGGAFDERVYLIMVVKHAKRCLGGNGLENKVGPRPDIGQFATHVIRAESRKPLGLGCAFRRQEYPFAATGTFAFDDDLENKLGVLDDAVAETKIICSCVTLWVLKRDDLPAVIGQYGFYLVLHADMNPHHSDFVTAQVIAVA